MGKLAIILVLAIAQACQPAHGQDAQSDAGETSAATKEDAPMQKIDLSAHRWRHRVLVLFSPSPKNADYTAMTKEIWARPSGMKDRHLIVYELFFEQTGMVFGRGVKQTAAHRLADELDVARDGFTYILVGKDGGVKLRGDSAVPVEEIYRTIDAMPMRRQEMRRQELRRSEAH